MAIDYDRFLEWAESRFGDVITKGEEVKLNSIFTEDHGHHLWCNPYGGKHGRPNGVFHCWKTDTKGSLVSLVMQVDNCTFEESLDILGGVDARMADLEKRVKEILTKKPEVVVEPKEANIALPPFTYPFDELPSTSYHRVQGEVYLFGRKLKTDGLMICTSGEYKSRIVIPYYDSDGVLVYYNTRYIGNSNKVLRYKGPEKDVGVGKGDVLYMPEWPTEGEEVFLQEGEFDALSVRQAGFYSGAFGGKALTDNQIIILRRHKFKPVICLDSDRAGKWGLEKMTQQLLTAGFSEFGFVRSPREHKDWNALLQKFGPKILGHYIRNNVKYHSGSHQRVDGEWTNLALKYKDL
jgi:hypothetical protein